MGKLWADGPFAVGTLTVEEVAEAYQYLPRFGECHPVARLVGRVEDVGRTILDVEMCAPFALGPGVLVDGPAERHDLSVVGRL